MKKDALLNNKSILLLITLVILLASISSVLGADITFSGYTRYVNGTPILNASVIIEVYNNEEFQLDSSYSNSSDSDGYWTITFDDIYPLDLSSNGEIKFVPKKFNSNGDVEYIGSILNSFPFDDMDPNGEFAELDITNITFYLKQGVTVNVTATGPPTKLQIANVTQNTSINASIPSGTDPYAIRGFDWDNTTNRWAYMIQPNTLIWLNASFGFNASYVMPNSLDKTQDFVIVNGSYYFVNDSQIVKYNINSSNSTVLDYNSTYNFSMNYSRLNPNDNAMYSIEYDYCNTTNDYFYVFANNATNDRLVIDKYLYNGTDFNYTTTYVRYLPFGKLKRYDCSYWSLITNGEISSDNMNSSISKLDNDFNEINNGWWNTPFDAQGFEAIQGATSVTDGMYVLALNDNTTKKIQLYGGTTQSFTYMVKDTKLGYPIQEEWQNTCTQVSVHLPGERNYSIEIFPRQSMPIYYDLNNVSAHLDLNEHHIDVLFNTTSSQIRVSGRVNLSDGTGTNFDEFYILNYLMEPGDMVFFGMPMPYNMSAWNRINNTPQSDIYSLTDGTFNISLEGTTMSSRVLMIPIVKMGSTYFAGFRNISPHINQDVADFNFTLYELIGQQPSNITAENGGAMNEGPGPGQNKIFTLNLTRFVFVNSTNSAIPDATGHIEVDLEYSKLDSQMPDFTWMFDVNQERGAGNFSLPLLDYSIKKMNVFSNRYEPLKLSFTAAQLNNPSINITLNNFDTGGIDNESFDDILVGMYKSNSNCDVPYPDNVPGCTLAGSNQTDFNPMNAVISGGKISFRITKESNNITVHYVNVDLIASGPPDAMFDEDSNNSINGSSLEQAWRFGSAGPEIYDTVIVGIPYNDSQVDESKPQTVLIEHLYDTQTWAKIWNSSENLNGLNTTAFSDYADFNQSWFNASYGNGGMSCQDISNFNVSIQGCYTDKTKNINWLVIPHFSGLGPQITAIAYLGNITSDQTVYSCYPNCSALINVTVNNSNFVGVQNITINNTAEISGLTYKIEYYNNTDSTWWYAGDENTNNTKIVDFNLTLGDNQFRINITMPVALSTKWNFSISLNGSTTYYTLDPYLDAINLTYPVDWHNSSESFLNFSFILHSNNWSNQSCDLIINGTAYGNNASVKNGSVTTISMNDSLLNGNYSWHISCNVTGNSINRTLNISDITAPNVSINIPATTKITASEKFNFTTSLDVATCKFSVNYTNSSGSMSISRDSNQTGVLLNVNGVKYCLSSNVIHFKNLNIESNYTLTIYINDSAGNSNTTYRNFTVTDTTEPIITFNSTANVTTTYTAPIIKWLSNEYTNASVEYGTVASLGTVSGGTNFSDSKTMTVSLPSLSASTFYYFNITTCDYQGNCVENGTYNFTTTAADITPETPTTTSSGGAATVPTTQGQSTEKMWASIEAGTKAVMTINNDNIPFTEVSFGTSEKVSDVNLKVAELLAKPSDVTIVGNVYKYMKITTTNLADEVLTSITLKFRVENSWLTTNNINQNNIALFRYNNKWNGLTTRVTSFDASYVYYEAESPGFSYFAIGAKGAELPEITEEEEEVAEEQEIAPPEEKVEEAETESQPEIKGEGKFIAWFKTNKTFIAIVVSAIILIGAIVGYEVYLKKKEKTSEKKETSHEEKKKNLTEKHEHKKE